MGEGDERVIGYKMVGYGVGTSGMGLAIDLWGGGGEV